MESGDGKPTRKVIQRLPKLAIVLSAVLASFFRQNWNGFSSRLEQRLGYGTFVPLPPLLLLILGEPWHGENTLAHSIHTCTLDFLANLKEQNGSSGSDGTEGGDLGSTGSIR